MALGFSNLDQAFILGSNQIKDTQEEIANLKKLINSTQTKQKSLPTSSLPTSSLPTSSLPTSSIQETPYNISSPPQRDFPPDYQNYMRIGPRDPVTANFTQNNLEDLNLLKVIGHPKFDDIVKGYVLINHPEWINSNLSQTRYNGTSRPSGNNRNIISYFGNNYSSNKYSSSVCSDIKKYIIFFIVCIIIFLALSWSYKS